MDGTAALGGASHAARRAGAPSAGQVFLGDARLAGAVVNHCRHLALSRVLGIPREQANLLTFALALAAADAAFTTTRRVLDAPFPLSSRDAAIGGALIQEAVFGIAGPAARKVPLAGTLLTVAMLGTLVPGLRRTVRGIRAAELRVRRQRMRVYAAARRSSS
jgi:hypothetical protein